MITYKYYNSLNDDIINIRTTVFVDEQGFVEEFDTIDNNSIFVVLYDSNKGVATARMNKETNTTYHIGRVAVLKEYRNKHLGSQLIELLEI